MKYYSIVEIQDLLQLVLFKLNVIVEVFNTVEKREFKAITSELKRGSL